MARRLRAALAPVTFDFASSSLLDRRGSSQATRATPWSRVASWSLTVGLLLAAGWVVASTVAATLRLVHPLPFQDQWAFLADYRDWLAGDYGLARLWRQHNEHRIPFARLFFFADVHWFGGQNRFLVTAVLTTQALHAAVLTALAWRLIAPLLARLSAAALVTLALGSALQINAFIWGFCIQYALALAAPTLAFAAVGVAARSDGLRRGGAFAAAVLLAAIGAASIASGLLVWPLLVSLAGTLGLRRRAVVIFGVAGIAFVVAYLVDYQVARSPLASVVDHPRHVLLFPLCLLGNPLAKLGPTAAAALGATGAVLTAAIGVRTLRRLYRGLPVARAELVLLHVVLFLAATALAVGIGRAHDPVNRALSSRYTMIGLAFWAGLLILLWGQCRRPLSDARSALQRALAVGSALFALALVGQQPAAARQFEPRLAQERLATAALLTGVDDPRAFDDLIPRWGTSLVSVLRQHRRSIFAGPWADLLGRPLNEHFTEAPPQSGAVTRLEPLPTGDGWRVFGWMADDEGLGHRLLLCQGSGIVVGFAVATGSDERGRTTWAGYVRPGPPQPVLAEIILGNDRVAALDASASPRRAEER